MPLTTDQLEQFFQQALPYEQYIATGSDQQKQNWTTSYNAVQLTNQQKQLLDTFTRQMNILVSSTLGCGDCVAQGPIIAQIANACPQINLRFIDRDSAPQLRDQITICAGTRVPVALFLAEDFAFCAAYGDRTLNRYRALAQQQLGSACSTGLFLPPAEEIAAVTQDWLNETERVQIMLRLSNRLRQKHND
ncbi:MAG: thioredoxin family protein [Sedimentisphaerales bacterium]|nr:thioredoxin family protein [Sedimentisphaerales bacterium]